MRLVFTSFCLGMPCKHIFPPVPCVLRELWHYLLRRSPCFSSLCLCFDSDNSWAYIGSRHWPEDHQNKGSPLSHSKHTTTHITVKLWIVLKDWLRDGCNFLLQTLVYTKRDYYEAFSHKKWLPEMYFWKVTPLSRFHLVSRCEIGAICSLLI